MIENTEIKQSMNELTEDILKKIYLSVLLVGLLFMFVNFLNELKLAHVSITYWIAPLYTGMLFIYLFASRFSFRFRAYAVILLILFAGLLSSFFYGMLGPAVLFYIGSAYTAMLLLSKKETVVLIAGAFIVYTAIYLLWVYEVLTPAFSLDTYTHSLNTFATRIVALLFFVGLIIVSQYRVNQFLVRKVNELNQARSEVRRTGEKLTVQEEIAATNREQARISQEHYSALIENTADLIFTMSPAGYLLSVNSKFAESTGMKEEDLRSQHFKTLIQKDGEKKKFESEWNHMLKTGQAVQFLTNRHDQMNDQLLTYEISMTPIFTDDDALSFVICRQHDVTVLMNKEKRIEKLAYYDQLTGLANRVHFEERVQESLSLSQTEDKQIGIIYLDLDRFKKVNDTAGHHAGDDLLKEASARMADVVQRTGEIARMGGDEFAVLFQNRASDTDFTNMLEQTAKDLIEKLEEPYYLREHSFYLSASVGIVCSPDHGVDFDVLMKNVDSAMYAAKNDGKGCWRWCSAAIESHS
ncbi:diguanylate cyclase domain-containing protein [Salisediminibacterium halotolerans]|uniref:PAS domain S-box-containing protein/diguanylate cyclase (GGDEF) domain-containing protein n=1 Tax=Salisediminibacterium halotolerans TaxID=517425 RepID=A0A1H9WAI3_9BACI|nr:diguanylate cyclase [Salisediminibacterium haloalkalitolerans]SES30920.1 PAS domain S-box-containing protein/diguanylate cyclase (GGDEF) domain-containing protein [Salisediminibacterium haloalkalitolerans]